MSTTGSTPPAGVIDRYEQNVLARVRDFNDPRQEWRRLFSEVLGTFMPASMRAKCSEVLSIAPTVSST